MSAVPEGFVLRPVADTDARGLQDLIGLCFADYPGCVLDVVNEEPGLRAPRAAYEAMWVVERTSDGLVAGCIAGASRLEADPPHAELKKLYVHPQCRGAGLARPLIEAMHAWAIERGLERLELWSDTKFLRAHAVYEHFGYRPTGAVRELHDVSLTAEYHFVRDA